MCKEATLLNKWSKQQLHLLWAIFCLFNTCIYKCKWSKQGYHHFPFFDITLYLEAWSFFCLLINYIPYAVLLWTVISLLLLNSIIFVFTFPHFHISHLYPAWKTVNNLQLDLFLLLETLSLIRIMLHIKIILL